jgi:hypothetical protein
MAKETIEAKYQLKDENNNAIVDEEGKPTWQVESVEYDFGDNLDDAVDLCGADVVYSQYKANAKVALQGIIRAKMKAGLDNDAIQAVCDAWKPGMVAERTAVDPATAIQNAFATWSDEKKAEFLAKLGVQA